jgi:hypothetical protein
MTKRLREIHAEAFNEDEEEDNEQQQEEEVATTAEIHAFDSGRAACVIGAYRFETMAMLEHLVHLCAL